MKKEEGLELMKENFDQIEWSDSDCKIKVNEVKIKCEDGYLYFKKKKEAFNKFGLTFTNIESVKNYIKNCEGKHTQQVAYSSYHEALTQICFGCRKIRTSLKENDLEK